MVVAWHANATIPSALGNSLWERGEEDEMKTPEENFYNILSSLFVNIVALLGLYMQAHINKQAGCARSEPESHMPV